MGIAEQTEKPIRRVYTSATSTRIGPTGSLDMCFFRILAQTFSIGTTCLRFVSWGCLLRISYSPPSLERLHDERFRRTPRNLVIQFHVILRNQLMHSLFFCVAPHKIPRSSLGPFLLLCNRWSDSFLCLLSFLPAFLPIVIIALSFEAYFLQKFTIKMSQQ